MIIGDRPHSAKTVLEELERRKAEIEQQLKKSHKPLGVHRSIELQQQLENIKKVLPPSHAMMVF